ncbi:SRPBCC domain-containing protein, partial [Rhizobium johnstonii]|uniref:SRPBCC domain-containing protein n=1 Tax=Rhizobium johnstonii TaxID=3019933 RepID=UPI003F96863A
LGPHDTTTTIDAWDASTGGNYRWRCGRQGEEIPAFYGSFHEVRENERIVQTQGYEPFPDAVVLETITFEDLGDGRTRVTSTTLVDSLETRDGII